jgi:GNAT superfamily N-acetyltransferase
VDNGNGFSVRCGEVSQRSDVVGLFASTGEANGWEYPPLARVKKLGSLEAWVWITPEALRWDAITTEGSLVGSVQLQLVKEHMGEGVNAEMLERCRAMAGDIAAIAGGNVDPLSLALVGRLVVHPGSRGRGCGRQLFRAAVNHARELGRVVALEVLATQTDAIGLYEREGGVVVGELTALSGVPLCRVWFPAGG